MGRLTDWRSRAPQTWLLGGPARWIINHYAWPWKRHLQLLQTGMLLAPWHECKKAEESRTLVLFLSQTARFFIYISRSTQLFKIHKKQIISISFCLHFWNFVFSLLCHLCQRPLSKPYFRFWHSFQFNTILCNSHT